MKKKELRKCRLCGETKAINEFEVDKRVKGGRTSRCKACKNGLDSKSDRLYRTLKHRAKKDGQVLEVTKKELQALLSAFDGKCVYCNASEEETGQPFHVDHIIPVSKSGRHHISNLVVACPSCNAQKGNRPFFEFYKAKKDEISDENFTALLYYVSFASGQPLEEVFKGFLADYLNENYPLFKDELGEEELKSHIDELVKKKIKTERAI